MEKNKIAVLYGGPSSEKEVSGWTAENMVAALERLKIENIKIDLSDKDWLEKVKEYSPTKAMLAVHGSFGEDGQLQKILEYNNINYTGSDSISSALSWDKLKSQEKAEELGIMVPKTIVVERGKSIPKLTFDFPVIVKPNGEGSSFGVTIVETPNDLQKAITNALKFDDIVLIQEYIKGTEVTSCVIDVFGKIEAMPLVEIRPKTEFFDFKAKYDAAYCDEIVPAKINEKMTKQIQDASEKIYKNFNCRDYARIDYMIKDDDYYFLEVNTLPGFTKTSLLPKAIKCSGIELDEFIKKLISN